MLCRTSVNILEAPCVVFISQWEGVKVFARVSGCVTLSVNITSHSFFLPHSVRLSQPVPFRARACVSAVSVAGVTAGLSVQEARLAHRQVVTWLPRRSILSTSRALRCVACGPKCTPAATARRYSPSCVTDALETLVAGAFGLVPSLEEFYPL